VGMVTRMRLDLGATAEILGQDGRLHCCLVLVRKTADGFTNQNPDGLLGSARCAPDRRHCGPRLIVWQSHSGLFSRHLRSHTLGIRVGRRGQGICIARFANAQRLGRRWHRVL